MLRIGNNARNEISPSRRHRSPIDRFIVNFNIPVADKSPRFPTDRKRDIYPAYFLSESSGFLDPAIRIKRSIERNNISRYFLIDTLVVFSSEPSRYP